MGRVSTVSIVKMPVIDTPFTRVAIDNIGPTHQVLTTKNRYILAIVEIASRYPKAVALPNPETTTVAEAMVDVFVG